MPKYHHTESQQQQKIFTNDDALFSSTQLEGLLNYI